MKERKEEGKKRKERKKKENPTSTFLASPNRCPLECICEAPQTEILISLFGVMYFCLCQERRYTKRGERKRDKEKERKKGRKAK